MSEKENVERAIAVPTSQMGEAIVLKQKGRKVRASRTDLTSRKYRILLFGAGDGTKRVQRVPVIEVAESATLEEATEIIKSLEAQRADWEKDNFQGEVPDAVRYLGKGSDIQAFADDPDEQVFYAMDGSGWR